MRVYNLENECLYKKECIIIFRMERIIFTFAHTLTHQQPPIPTIIIIIIMSDENDEKVLFKT